LHFDITPEKLAQPHQSRPWNPIIASVFYRTGIIEQWGTGTLKVIDWCGGNANPAPIWKETSGSVVVTFRPAPGFEQTVRQVTPEVTPEVAKILPLCAAPNSKRELQLAAGIRDEKYFREAYLRPALEAGLLERTTPEKPISSRAASSDTG